jgi:hypothetical protein
MLRPLLPDRPFTTREAVELGLSHHDLGERVADGRLRRPFTGVYVRADLPDSTLLGADARPDV